MDSSNCILKYTLLLVIFFLLFDVYLDYKLHKFKNNLIKELNPNKEDFNVENEKNKLEKIYADNSRMIGYEVFNDDLENLLSSIEYKNRDENMIPLELLPQKPFNVFGLNEYFE